MKSCWKTDITKSILTIRIVCVLLFLPLAVGCSIPGRTVTEERGQGAADTPVILDVYDRSVREDVYTPGSRGERIIPDPAMLEPQSTLKDKL